MPCSRFQSEASGRAVLSRSSKLTEVGLVIVWFASSLVQSLRKYGLRITLIHDVVAGISSLNHRHALSQSAMINASMQEDDANAHHLHTVNTRCLYTNLRERIRSYRKSSIPRQAT